MAGSQKLFVTVVSPEGEIYKGEALAVSSANETGRFDILPQHANFITLVKDKAVIKLSRSQGREIEFKQGILYCHRNKVEIFLGVA